MRKRRWAAATIGVAVAIAAAAGTRFRRFVIREESMRPDLAPGDWVIARRRAGPLQRGDVVVFDDPTGSGLSLVKRVIGLPGEAMGIDGGRVTVDGALLADRWAHGVTAPDGSWAVGDGAVWLLGDNRPHSVSDGRLLGPTPIDDIEWVVTGRYWPTDRIGRL